MLSAVIFLSSCGRNDTATSETKSDTSSPTTSETTVETSPSETSSVTTEGSDPSLITVTEAPDGTGFPVSGDMKDAHDELAEEFRKLPGVVNVQKRSHYDDSQYVLFFEMPVDHKDPAKGTFLQRVYVKYRGKDAPNMCTIGGYNLYYGMYDGDFYNEAEPLFSEKYGCNLIEPEYRFDGNSRPDGFSSDKADYWEYLTCEQASQDFHEIIESLKTFFSGKWCIEGMSKGGEFTAYQLGRHPEDADLFIAECAMLKIGQNSPGLCDYIYTTAGDDRYGKEKAKRYRELLFEFQLEMFKHEDEFLDQYWKNATEMYGLQFSSSFTKEILYECTVFDLVHIFQYDSEDMPDGDYYEMIEQALALKDSTTDWEKRQFRDKSFEVMENLYGPWHYAYLEKDVVPSGDELNLYSYMFQSYREDGYYAYDFSYFRDALKKEGSDVSLYITEEMEPEVFGYRITDEHKELFSYNPDVLNTRIGAVEKTEKPLIIVNGLSDIFQVSEMKESDNPNVHIFNLPASFHDEVTLDYLSDEQFKEYDEVVRSALNI
ncbi:MAG: S28 family serine protease [Saccharofermentanaceae bacterium]|nr:S28 family serine protease [Saccharofermentanaceae bacterium]